MGTAASRFLKATVKKFTPAAPPVPSASSSRNLSISTTAGTAPKKEPGWKKFDLQASLARPLGYVPRKSALTSLTQSGRNLLTAC